MNKVTALRKPEPEITKTLRFTQIPREDFYEGGHRYRFHHLIVQDDGTVLATYRFEPQGYRPDEAADDQKKHAQYLRATKPMRAAAKRIAADLDGRRRDAEARCWGDWLSGGTRDVVCEFLDIKWGTENYIAFLEKIAPAMQEVFAQSAGFQTWAEFVAAYEAKIALEEAEYDEASVSADKEGKITCG